MRAILGVCCCSEKLIEVKSSYFTQKNGEKLGQTNFGIFGIFS